MISRKDKFLKRTFDVLLSIIAILLTWWIILISWMVASVETKSNALFTQKRVGKDAKLFFVFKIKTMKKIADMDTTVTTAHDVRITKSGAFFRKTKIDELPQLFNVLFGDMSFVGPRPDVSGYADRLQGEERIVLSVRPGITGPASLKYKNEEDILANQEDAQFYNDTVIWPDKVKINSLYVKNYSFRKDIEYI
mgnify:FL=1